MVKARVVNLNRLRGNEWTLALATLLILFGILLFTAMMSGAFSYYSLTQPLIAIFLIVMGILYIRRVIRHEAVRGYVRFLLWFFALIIVLTTIYWFGGANDNTCTGLMGAQTSCMDVNRLYITILLLNPFSLILWMILAGSGVIGLLVKPVKS